MSRPTLRVLAGTIAVTASAGLGLMTLPATAASFTVSTTADVVDAGDSLLSLREAVNGANRSSGDDVIVLPPGVHTLSVASAGGNNDNTGGDLDHLDGGRLTIRGAGLDVTMIDAAGLNDRILDMRSGDLVLEDLTVRNGTVNAGGGAVRAAGSLAATRLGVTANSTTSEGGGGLRVAGDVSIAFSRLDGNSSADNGGAIRSGGALTIVESVLSGNTAANAGGAAYAPGAIELIRTMFGSNTAAADGGALWTGGSTLTIADSTFSANRAGGNGGAVRAQDPTTTITASTFTANAATVGGGAIRQRHGSISVTNSTFDTNSAPAGGAIWLRNAVADVTHATIAHSESSTEGSVRAAGGSTVTFASTVIAPASGSACTVAGTVNSAGSNAATDRSCLLTGAGDQNGTAVPDLQGLDTNDGTTMTRLPGASSTLIDASTCDTGEDQRGTSRPEGARCEIGAVELRVPVPQPDAATTPQDVAVTVDVAGTATVLDGHVDPTTAATTWGPTNGTTTDGGDGTITYTPPPGWSGTDNFTYQLCGPGESVCTTAVATITVVGAPTSTTTSTTAPARVPPPEPRLDPNLNPLGVRHPAGSPSIGREHRDPPAD